MDNNNLMNNNNYNQDTSYGTYTVINDVPANEGKGMAIASMVLGICACCLFWCYGIVGVVLGTIGLVLSLVYKKRNGKLSGMSLAGFITSIIGLVLGALVLIYFIFVFALMGSIMNATIGALL